MQAALEALREEGYAVKDEDLVHVSPARFAHIHRYGKYHFDGETVRSGVGCDHSVSRPITALPPFFVRTLPDPRILLVNPQVPNIMPRHAFVEGPNIIRIQCSNSSRIAWK